MKVSANVDTIHLERDMDLCAEFNGSHSNIKVFKIFYKKNVIAASLRHS